MKPMRKLNRRSFLERVAGGVVVVGGGLALLGSDARAWQLTDHDPTDPVNQGRGGGTGITDSDSGPGADVAGRGRGGPPRPGSTGVTDSDSGPNADAVGRGRGGTGITDSDSGPYADPRGRGRGGVRGSGSSDLPEQQRLERCENNRRVYAEMSRDGAAPDTWSEGQLVTARADLDAVIGAAQMMRSNRTGDPAVANRAWAIVEPIGRRYGIPVTRLQGWDALANQLNQWIYDAQSSSIRAERMRQLQTARTNLVALGC